MLWFGTLVSGEKMEITVSGFSPTAVISATASPLPNGPGGGGAGLDVALKSLVLPGGSRLVSATIRNEGPDVTPGFVLQFGWIW